MKPATSTMWSSRAIILMWITMSLDQRSAGRSVNIGKAVKPGLMLQKTMCV